MENRNYPDLSIDGIVEEYNQTVIWLTDNVIELNSGNKLSIKEKKVASGWFDQLITQLQKIIRRLRDPETAYLHNRPKQYALDIKQFQEQANVHSAFYELPTFNYDAESINFRFGVFLRTNGTAMVPSVYPGSILLARVIDKSEYELAVGKLVAVTHYIAPGYPRRIVLGRLSKVTESSITLSYDNSDLSDQTFPFSMMGVLCSTRSISVIVDQDEAEEGGQTND